MIFSYWTIYLFSYLVLHFSFPETGNKDVIKERTRTRAENASVIAREHYASKRYATALCWFSKSVEYAEMDKVDSCWIFSMIGMANSYRNLNKLDKTESSLDEIESNAHFIPYKNTIGYASFLLSKSSLLRKKGNPTEALNILDSLISHTLLWKNQLDTFFSLPYETKAYMYLNSNELDSSLKYYKKALLTWKLTKKTKNPSIINIYIGIVKVYELKNDIANQLDFMTQTLSLANNMPIKDTLLLIKYNQVKLAFNSKLGKYDEALQSISQIDSLTNNNPSKLNYYIDGELSKSRIYFDRGDLDRAESIYIVLLKTKNLLKVISHDKLTYLYFSLARIYYDKEEFRKALTYFQKSVDINNSLSLDNSSNFNGMGSCNFLLGDTIKAEEYYKKAISTRIQLYGKNTHLLSREYLSYSIFLKRIGRIKEGFNYVTKALSLYLKENGEKYVSTSESYSWLGTFYLDGGQPLKALECFQRAIVSAVEGFGDYTITANPDLGGNYYGPELIEALKYKAQALDSAFHQNPKNIELLRCEFNTYDLALQAIHKQRTSFPEMKSKLSVSGNERSTYIGAIHAAYQLFRHTGDPLYKNRAFEFAEKSRSAILLTSLKEKQAMSYGGLPDSLVQQEKTYSQLIEKYQGMLVEEKHKQGANPEIIKEFENKIFQVRNQQNDLIARFEREYPQYYQLKYTNKTLDISTIQKRLTENAVILEYTLTDKNILIFVITKNKFELVPVSRTGIFDKNLGIFNQYLREVSFVSQDRLVYENFLNAGFSLYRNLIGPVLPLIRNKELIIIPDETLSSIPFEVLLTAQADPMQEFNSLPYLVEQYPIGYAYSANLLFFNYKKQIPEKVRLAAFSPSYEMTVRGNPKLPYLKPLKFSKEEAQTASEFFKGRVFDGENATESNFKDVVEKYDILHLAMHAILDNENPMYSKLAFTREEDKKEDGFLNTYELFNLKLKARMVVLSACNTGAGTLQKGEGIMSLARGFYYAGCPDVVMTLWPVEDRMSTQLIKDFYTYLSKGMDKIQALRLAKLNLIRSSDPLRSHPFFWAGYVNFGDISPVISVPKKKPTGMLWVLTIGISVMLIIPMVWKKLRF